MSKSFCLHFETIYFLLITPTLTCKLIYNIYISHPRSLRHVKIFTHHSSLNKICLLSISNQSNKVHTWLRTTTTTTTTGHISTYIHAYASHLKITQLSCWTAKKDELSWDTISQYNHQDGRVRMSSFHRTESISSFVYNYTTHRCSDLMRFINIGSAFPFHFSHNIKKRQ